MMWVLVAPDLELRTRAFGPLLRMQADLPFLYQGLCSVLAILAKGTRVFPIKIGLADVQVDPEYL